MLGLLLTGWQALRARTALEQAAADFERLAGQLKAGDLAGARTSLGEAQEAADRARRNVQGPGWWLGARLPVLGDDVTAVRTVAAVADGLASRALPEVLDAAGVLTPERLRPVDGRVELEPIRRVEPSVVRAAEEISSLARQAGTLDPDALLAPVAAPVTDLQGRLAEASDLADRASRAVRLLPPMLGGDGRRNYVLMFQNNAEVRATGGIPGAFALLTADRGRVVLGRQSDAGRLGTLDRPVLPLSADELRLFGDELGRFPQDVNFTPDFPRTAALVQAMWERRYGVRVDGVVSTDPVALSYVLAGTGPVDAGATPVGSENAVPLLLSQVYADIADPARQNRFFDAVARSVFGAVVTGQGDSGAVLAGLTRSVQERRTMVWAARKNEQALLEPTALAGSFPQARTATPHVGVYLNAALPYKLDYYLDHEADLDATRCQDGRQRLTVTVRLTSTVPAAYRDLTDYVAPDAPIFGKGTIVDTLYVTAPAGGEVRRMTVDGADATPQIEAYGARPVVVRSVVLDPGESRVIEVRMVTGAGQTGDPDLRATPGVRTDGVGRVSPSACS